MPQSLHQICPHGCAHEHTLHIMCADLALMHRFLLEGIAVCGRVNAVTLLVPGVEAERCRPLLVACECCCVSEHTKHSAFVLAWALTDITNIGARREGT